MRTMRIVVAGLTALVVSGALTGCHDAPGPVDPTASAVVRLGATTVTTNDQVPFNSSVFVPCANGGAGEVVVLSGTLHLLSHQTVSNSGNFHVKFHAQPQGVSGVGLTTGDQYRATGVTQEEFHSNGPLPITDTFINNFRIIGQGPGNNFSVHQTIHITINANGVLTAFVDNTNVDCK